MNIPALYLLGSQPFLLELTMETTVSLMKDTDYTHIKYATYTISSFFSLSLAVFAICVRVLLITIAVGFWCLISNSWNLWSQMLYVTSSTTNKITPLKYNKIIAKTKNQHVYFTDHTNWEQPYTLWIIVHLPGFQHSFT